MFIQQKIKLVFILLLSCFQGNVLFSQNNTLLPKILNTESKPKYKVKEVYDTSNNFAKINADSDINFSYLDIMLTDSLKEKVSKPESYRIIAKNYAEKRQYKLALNNYNYAVYFYEKLNNQDELADIYNSIGIIYGKIYNYDKALFYIHKSILILIKGGDNKKISKSLNNLGVLYRGLKDFNKAQTIFQQSLYFARISGDEISTASSLNNISLNYIQTSNYKEALKYQLESIKIYKKFNNKKRLCSSYISGGLIYKKLNYNKIAIDYFNKSIKLAAEVNDQYLLSLALQNIGSAYLYMKDYAKSIVYLKQSETVANNIQDWGCMKSINEVLSEYYSQTGDCKNAFLHYKAFKAINDTIFNKESKDRFIDLQVKYEVEEKDNENKILKQESLIQQLAIQKQTYLRNTFIAVSIIITMLVFFILYRFYLKKIANKVLFDKNQQINLQKTQLEEAYTNKDKLFAVITHDLKNPFGSIVSLSSFLESNFYKLEDTHKYKGIGSLKRSILEIYYLLENLSDWLNSNANNFILNKTNFDLNSSISSVIKLYRTSAEQKSIDLHMNVHVSTFVYGDERMIKTVLRNLIDNATKFTPANGKIEVNAKEEADKMIVSVSDSGIGINESNKLKLFKLENQFLTGGGGGLGLILSKKFVEKNDGELWFESEEGKGTTFFFSINKGVSYEED